MRSDIAAQDAPGSAPEGSSSAGFPPRETSLVSIVLPTYKRAQKVGGAIESCLAQTYRNIELIVVDDGSPDNTCEVVAAFCERDPRVQYICQENQKLPAALNTGHHAARGKYLTWTSDDNRYEPAAIETMVRYLEQHPDVGLVYCNVRGVDPEGKTIRNRRRDGPEKIWQVCCVGACFLYRREVFETVGEYDRNLFLAEDYDFWLRVSKRFKMAHLDGEPLYTALMHGDSLSERFRPDVELQCARARAKNANNWIARRKFLAEGRFNAGYGFRERREYGLAFRHLLCSIAAWPLSMNAYRCLAGLITDMLRNRAAMRAAHGGYGSL